MSNWRRVRELEDLLWRSERRFDDMRRQLHREFELRTMAIQAQNERLLGLLSGQIAREPMPPIIVCDCKKLKVLP